MKSRDIIYIYNCGITMITTHSLNSSDAYKVYKFKRFIENAYKEITTKQLELVSECGIDNISKFNERLKQLSTSDTTEDEQQELIKMKETLNRFNLLDEELLNEEIELTNIQKITYESWFALQNENQSIVIRGRASDILSGKIEGLLENTLWEVPTE